MTLAPAAPPALPALPTSGSTDWYPHYQGLDARARTAVPRVLTPEAYGAVGDGAADDQAALQRMLDDLKEGERVLLAGQYRHSNVLRVMVPRTTWTQLGRLIATNSQRAAVQLGPEAHGTTWVGHHNDVDWGSETPVRGGTDILTAGLAAWDTHSIDIRGVRSTLSRQCGVYFSTVKRFRLSGVDVRLSRADSVHLTHNCEDGVIDGVIVTESGDDAVAIVSYLRRGSGPSDPPVEPCRRISVRNVRARFGHARGCTILGGEDITISGIDVAHMRAAGCYLGSESGYQTHSPVRCIMRQPKVRDVGYPVPPLRTSATDDPGLDHGHLFMLSQQPTPVVDSGYEDADVAGGSDLVFNATRAITNGGATYQGCFYRRVRLARGRERAAGITIGGSTAGVTYERIMDLRGAAPAGGAVSGALGQAVSARLAGNFSAPSGTASVLSWTGTDAADTNNLHDPAANPARLTARVAGVYKVEAFISFNTNNAGNRHAYMQVNGSASFVDEIRPAVQGFATRMATGGVVTLAAGDFVTVGVYHEAGSAVTVEASLSSFSMYGIG